jgi:hypothetical protein
MDTLHPQTQWTLISADSHVTEPPDCYTKRVDRRYRETAPRVVSDANGGDAFVIDGVSPNVPYS